MDDPHEHPNHPEGTTPDGGGTSQPGPADGGSDGGQASTCLTPQEALELSPANHTVTVSATPQPIPYTATARTASGTRDVTRQVAWSVARTDDTPPGSITAEGVYQPEPGTGGVVTVTASDACGRQASTSLTLRLETTIAPPPAEVASRFDGTVVTGNATRSPSVVYPSDQTRFPRNIFKVLFQWKRGGNSLFRLTFEGPYSRTVVYTDGQHASCAAATGAGCWEADEDAWLAIAGSNAGEVTTLTVEGVADGDPNVYRAAPIRIGFSRRDVKGAIFYWSTTAAGIRRASVSDEAPEPYLVGKPIPTQLANGSKVECVACHTVSRSGRKMFAGTKTDGLDGEYVYDVTLQSPPTPVITTQISTETKGFGTFSPDDTRVVATVGALLAEFDSTTGERINTLPVTAGTNPDWSPTGTELVFSDRAGDSPAGASLQVIARAGSGWGATRMLAPANGLSNLFPSYSPDGAYIAYARGKGGHGDVTAQLFLVKADGSQTPVELVTANRVVNNTVTTGQFENNMPTWAPSGDLYWVAFNSLRPYGVVFPNGGRQQIWVAAIDPAKLGTGEDPSFPAFRFSFQNLSEDNHRAFWTLDVRDPDVGPTCRPAGSDCAPDTSGQCCDGLSCLPASELTYSCQVPSDGGTQACIQAGGACSQTSGDPCCSGLVCDVPPGGGADGGSGTVCQNVIIG